VKRPEDIIEKVGVIHIHTKDSDGSKTHRKIIEMGKSYDLGFLVFTDHMTLKHKPVEGLYGKLLVIVGYEHEDQDGINHFLIFGVNSVLARDLSPKQYVHRVKQVGGLGIIAHPDEVRDFEKYPPLPWTEWETDEFHGIEIWNHMSEWVEGLANGNKLKYLFKPRSLLVSPPKTTLERWDRLNKRRKVVGIASADAHGHKVRIWGPVWKTVFPYKVELNSLRTHVLFKRPYPKDFQKAKQEFFEAIMSCRVFISNHRWGDARGFKFWAESDRNFATIGGRIVITSKLKMFIQAPKTGRIVLIRNGKEIERTNDKNAIFPVKSPGLYRIEVWLEDKGWIFTNHIRVVPPYKRTKTTKKSTKGKQ